MAVENQIDMFNTANKTYVKTFAELISRKQGQEFWRANGFSVDCEFALTAGSYSQQTLKNYLENRYGK